MKILCKIWMDWIKPIWSKIRWTGKNKETAAPCEETAKTIQQIKSACSNVYRHFRWTMDDISELFDSFTPVEYLYNKYKEAEDSEHKLEDDCDGFHSIIHHILAQNGVESYILSIATKPIKNSHTMCIFKLDDSYYLVDYTSVKKYGTSVSDIVNEYISRKKYDKAYYWNTQYWDYKKNKYKNIKLK